MIVVADGARRVAVGVLLASAARVARAGWLRAGRPSCENGVGQAGHAARRLLQIDDGVEVGERRRDFREAVAVEVVDVRRAPLAAAAEVTGEDEVAVFAVEDEQPAVRDENDLGLAIERSRRAGRGRRVGAPHVGDGAEAVFVDDGGSVDRLRVPHDAELALAIVARVVRRVAIGRGLGEGVDGRARDELETRAIRAEIREADRGPVVVLLGVVLHRAVGEGTLEDAIEAQIGAGFLQRENAVTDDDFREPVEVDVRQRGRRIVPRAAVAQVPFVRRDDFAAIVQDLEATVLQRDDDFGIAVVVEIADGERSGRSRACGTSRATIVGEVVAFEPVRRAAQGEIVVPLVRPAAVHRADDAVLRDVDVVAHEEDFREIQLVDPAVLIVVVEVRDDGGRGHLARDRERMSRRLRMVMVGTAPAELELRKHVLERSRRQRAGGRGASACAGAALTARVLGTVPFVFAAAAGVADRRIVAGAREVSGAAARVRRGRLTAVRGADDDGVAVATSRARLARVVDALLLVAEAVHRAVNVALAGNIGAEMPSARRRLALFRVTAIEVVACVVDAACALVVFDAALTEPAGDVAASVVGGAGVPSSAAVAHGSTEADGDAARGAGSARATRVRARRPARTE